MSPSKKNANQPFNATRRKVLIVSPGIPHPKRGASTVLFFCYIDAMKKAGFEILHLLLLQPGSAKTEELNNYTDSIQELRRFKVLPCWSDVFIQSGRLGHNLNQQAVQQVREEVEEFQADMIISFDLMRAWSSVIFSCDR